MLKRNPFVLIKGTFIDGENKPYPPVRHRVEKEQVLLHPPRLRMALPLCHSKVLSLLR